MKYFTLVIATFFSLYASAQTQGNSIVGKWMKMPKKDLIIEVYESGGGYNGKIQWSSDSSKPKGYVILKNLQFDNDNNSWENGKIYDPRSGSEYKATAKLKPDGTLEVLGYKGLKFIGSKKSFKRVM
ncbi:MAG: DUF2147 domain-containing protein [Rhizobacter sp.]|nr:DUF2147 domain-containing protein [Ferruginibacter sp.]